MIRQRRFGGIITAALSVVVALCVLLLFIYAINNISSGSEREVTARLERSLKLAALSCYSTEGYYPPTLDDLIDHSGIHVDRERYTVYYDVFAENLMPDITVLEVASK